MPRIITERRIIRMGNPRKAAWVLIVFFKRWTMRA
jgi:hypothetical protein